MVSFVVRKKTEREVEEWMLTERWYFLHNLSDTVDIFSPPTLPKLHHHRNPWHSHKSLYLFTDTQSVSHLPISAKQTLIKMCLCVCELTLCPKFNSSQSFPEHRNFWNQPQHLIRDPTTSQTSHTPFIQIPQQVIILQLQLVRNRRECESREQQIYIDAWNRTFNNWDESFRYRLYELLSSIPNQYRREREGEEKRGDSLR